jgi:hypothetical protein
VSGGTAVEVVYLPVGRDSVHDLRLLGRGKVTVRVVDGGGAPIDRAIVTLWQTGYAAQIYDGAIEPSNDGVISFEHITEGGFSVSVRDMHGRGGRAWGVIAAPDSNGVIAPIDLKVSLTVTGSVTGRFYMPDGTTPIPFGTVTLVAQSQIIGRDTTAGTDRGRPSTPLPASAHRGVRSADGVDRYRRRSSRYTGSAAGARLDRWRCRCRRRGRCR